MNNIINKEVHPNDHYFKFITEIHKSCYFNNIYAKNYLQFINENKNSLRKQLIYLMRQFYYLTTDIDLTTDDYLSKNKSLTAFIFKCTCKNTIDQSKTFF